MLTVTNPVEIDQQEVSSLVGVLKSLSLSSIIKIVLLIVVLVVLVKLLCRLFDRVPWSAPGSTEACMASSGQAAGFCCALWR